MHERAGAPTVAKDIPEPALGSSKALEKKGEGREPRNVANVEELPARGGMVAANGRESPY
jgi:hypothetical protein